MYPLNISTVGQANYSMHQLSSYHALEMHLTVELEILIKEIDGY